ncbi:MAG: hypothetical protein KDD40_02405 [Bdellovibrionales bacterium]|nr:hypothetical protein [Bdellovibrionales bacterium]
MKTLIVLLFSNLFCFFAAAYESTMQFTPEELNKNDLIASSGTEVAMASRVLQLQLRASGCIKPIITSPDMFTKSKVYHFNVEAENCLVIPKTSRCDSNYLPRYLKANPHSQKDAIVGYEKYIICLKNSTDTTAGSDTQSIK